MAFGKENSPRNFRIRHEFHLPDRSRPPARRVQFLAESARRIWVRGAFLHERRVLRERRHVGEGFGRFAVPSLIEQELTSISARVNDGEGRF
jgi:hypothetical protein